jgi:DDE family transposase
MYPSEMMTIVILFQQSHYRTFKAYYTEYVQRHLRSEFPTLVSYQRFVELMPTLLVPLVAYLHTQLGRCSGISFIDSTPLAVCHNARIHSHRVFAGRAARGKTSVGWFFGFKLHLVVNDQGELLAFCLTPGNVDDRHPVPKLATGLIGKLFGDKGYLSQPLAQHLLVTHGLHLVTKLRKKMHNRLLDWSDRLLLRKRAIIETITDQLKNISETRAFAPSQPHQLPGQPGRRADCVLSSAQKAFSWGATPYSCGGLAYPELTLRYLLERFKYVSYVGIKSIYETVY